MSNSLALVEVKCSFFMSNNEEFSLEPVFQLESNGGDGSSSTFGLKWISTPHTHLGGFLFAPCRRLHL
ncbi:unnamed protein product [Sphagnum balticum]